MFLKQTQISTAGWQFIVWVVLQVKKFTTMDWLSRLEIQEIYSSSFVATPNSVLPLQPEAHITANSQVCSAFSSERMTANNRVFSLHFEAQHSQEASFQLSFQTAR